jgi:hypothetical protein
MAWPIIKEGMLDWHKRSKRSLPKRGISYLMVWRNDSVDPKNFYGPAPGHQDVENFKELMELKRFKFMK